MRLPGAVSRSVLSPALIAIILVSISLARGGDATTPQPASPAARPQRVILRPGNSGIAGVAIGRRLRTFPMIAGGVFPPRSAGAGADTALVSDASTGAQPIPPPGPAGNANDQLGVDPAAIDFGTVPVGSNANQNGTLIASDSDVTIASANFSDPEFTLSGLSFPVTIPAGGHQDYTVIFTPVVFGKIVASLSFLTDTGGSLAIQGLTGIGGDLAAHWVNLSWDAGTSTDVVGYNVYRSQASGGPYAKINSVLDGNTFYTDVFVSMGATYYYMTRAVDSEGQESGNSNEVQATIP
jgi:hypothetical protein